MMGALRAEEGQASLDPSHTPGTGATALSVQHQCLRSQCTPLMRFVPLGVN